MSKTPEFDPRDPYLYNAFINGNMDFFQRGISITRTQALNQNGYLADRMGSIVGGSSVRSITTSRSNNVPSGLIFPALFSCEALNNTALPSLAASDYTVPFYSWFEGSTIYPLFGNNMTVGFWLYSSFSGTLPVSLRNGLTTFSYVTTIQVSSGWQFYSIIIPWTSNISTLVAGSAAMILEIGAASGSNLNASSLNAWIAGNFTTHSTCTNWLANVGNTLRLAQIQVRAGELHSEEIKNSFSRHASDFATELRACQRYYEIANMTSVGDATNGNVRTIRSHWKVTKRTNPIVSSIGNLTQVNGGGGDFSFSGTGQVEGISTAVLIGGGTSGYNWSGLCAVDAEF